VGAVGGQAGAITFAKPIRRLHSVRYHCGVELTPPASSSPHEKRRRGRRFSQRPRKHRMPDRRSDIARKVRNAYLKMFARYAADLRTGNPQYGPRDASRGFCAVLHEGLWCTGAERFTSPFEPIVAKNRDSTSCCTSERRMYPTAQATLTKSWALSRMIFLRSSSFHVSMASKKSAGLGRASVCG